MTVNKINSKCSLCGCATADVLGLIEFEKKTLVVMKCIEKHHQYALDSRNKNTEWKKFFKHMV